MSHAQNYQSQMSHGTRYIPYAICIFCLCNHSDLIAFYKTRRFRYQSRSPARYLDFARRKNEYSRNRDYSKPCNGYCRRLLWHRRNIFLVLISLFQTQAVA